MGPSKISHIFILFKGFNRFSNEYGITLNANCVPTTVVSISIDSLNELENYNFLVNKLKYYSL